MLFFWWYGWWVLRIVPYIFVVFFSEFLRRSKAAVLIWKVTALQKLNGKWPSFMLFQKDEQMDKRTNWRQHFIDGKQKKEEKLQGSLNALPCFLVCDFWIQMSVDLPQIGRPVFCRTWVTLTSCQIIGILFPSL